MKIIFLVSVFILSVARPLAAADDTVGLLEARRIKREMLFEISSSGGTPVVFYVADSSRANSLPAGGAFASSGAAKDILRDNDTFASNGVVNLVYHNFNPFTITLAVKETSAPEPLLTGLGDFLNALIATATTITGDPGALLAGEALAKREDCREVDCKYVLRYVPPGKDFKKMSADELLIAQAEELRRCEAAREAALVACVACNELKTKILRALSNMSNFANIKVTDEDRNRWVKNSIGLTRIFATRGEIAQRKSDIDTGIGDLEKDRQALEKIAGEAPFGSRTAPPCIDASVYAAAAYVATNAGRVIESQKALGKALGEILRILDQVTESSRWASNEDYIFGTVESDPASVKTVDLSFAATSLDTSGTPVLKQQSATTRKMLVRFYRRFVSEFGAAAVYNDLRYPKYKVKEEAGVKKVVSDGFDSTNVNAAATYNLLCNCIGIGPLFPGFQIGVSTAKSYPGLLAGIVLRFAQPKKFSIATGQMITWYKDLDKLKIDSVVASPNDLSADLKRRRSPTTWYIAAQYKF